MKQQPLLPVPPVFDNSYARLPERFFSHQLPTPVAAPALIRVNKDLATQLGIDPAWLESAAGLAMLAGNTMPDGATPIATVYAGHQFGNWNPQLGDGRAVLLGELLDSQGQRFDLQLKGSGPTVYSRGGDGRAPLGPVLREYIVSEAMFALGVPTTRSLAAVTTGEGVWRETALPGGVLARVARSHIRFGTFQFFAARKDIDGLKLLADHVIARHYPDAANSDNPYLALLGGVISNVAALVSQWQQVGFIHGVMNTDNMLLSGETIDYGPCAFMDNFDPQQVYSAIDQGARYAYQNQPEIAHWNLMTLAQALLPLIDADQEQAVTLARAALDTFPTQFHAHHLAGMAAKLGLTAATADDETLVRDLLTLMTQEKLDYTLTFRHLSDPLEHSLLPTALQEWLVRWHARAALEAQPEASRYAQMQQRNPLCIPRNHLLEAVIHTAQTTGDLGPFNELADVLATPFDNIHRGTRFALPPRPEELVEQTFCGT
jgi:uncharacterized protein YdiU (UPF0061 family)